MTEQVFQVHASIRQQTFRRLLHAMSMPGEIQSIADRDGLPVFLVVLNTLVDGSVTLSDVDNLIPPLALRALRAPLTTSEEARFVLADASRSVVDTFRVDRGTLISPERGATVVLNGDSISANEAPDEDFLTVRLSGPGIAARRILALRGFHPSWFMWRNRVTASFPLGCDLVLTDRRGLACLPRTTCIELSGEER